MACRYKSPFEVIQSDISDSNVDNAFESFESIDLEESQKNRARKSYVLFQIFIRKQLSTSKSVDVTKTKIHYQFSRKHMYNDKAGILLANAKKNVMFHIEGHKYVPGYDY